MAKANSCGLESCCIQLAKMAGAEVGEHQYACHSLPT
jgi:hypothetical protein